MKDLIKDKDGKVCAAKVAYMLTLTTCLAKVFIVDAPDYAGMAVLLTAVGGVYWGRSHTKGANPSK